MKTKIIAAALLAFTTDWPEFESEAKNLLAAWMNLRKVVVADDDGL